MTSQYLKDISNYMETHLGFSSHPQSHEDPSPQRETHPTALLQWLQGWGNPLSLWLTINSKSKVSWQYRKKGQPKQAPWRTRLTLCMDQGRKVKYYVGGWDIPEAVGV
jgi:hypothetical protein